MAYILREGLVPVGLTLTPAFGKFSDTLDRQLIKMIVVEEEKEGVEAPQETERRRDGIRVQLRCIFFHFQCNFYHCFYSKGSQPGWAHGETYKATVDQRREALNSRSVGYRPPGCTQLGCTIPSQRTHCPEPKGQLTSFCVSKCHPLGFGSIRQQGSPSLCMRKLKSKETSWEFLK